jgi:outer membrane receptor protein involved in Fe transport
MSRLLLATTALAALASSPALAQSAVRAETIIVTAEKRAEALEDVPLAVTVISGQDAARRGISDFAGLVDETPGVSINYAFGGASYGLFTIRGVGGADDYKPNGSPSVALHVDGVYQTSNGYLNTPLFDLERIEILKGPQGTLYGRNTTAGVVNAITRGPGADTSGYLDVKAGSFEFWSAQGAVGGRFNERFAARIAVFTEQGGGFMDGQGAGLLAGFQPVIGGVRQTQVPAVTDPGRREGYGDKDVFAGRVTLEFKPIPDGVLTVKLFASSDQGEIQPYDRIERARDATQFNAGEDADPFKFFSNRYLGKDISISGLTASWEQSLPGGRTLSVLANAQGSDRKVGGNGDGTPLPQFEFFFDEAMNQQSVEARLADAPGGAFDWIVGAFLINDAIDFDSIWTTFSARTIYTHDYAQERNSAAAFTNVDWYATPALRVTAGLRYTSDEVTYRGRNLDLNPWGISTFRTTFATVSPFAWDEDFSDDDFSGKLTLAYQVNDALNLFASVGRGYRGGGFDGTSIFTVEETLPFDSETVLAYEAGLRFTTPRLRASLDVFANQFEELQATTRLSNDTNGRTNVGEADLSGVEGSLSAVVIETDRQSLTLQASATFLESEIQSFRSARVAEALATIGDPLPGAPDVTARVAFIHEIVFANGRGLRSEISANHHGEESNRLNAVPGNTSEPYTLVNARIEFAVAEGWSAYVYGRNITDEVYFPELNGPVRLVGAPATFGAGLRVDF